MFHLLFWGSAKHTPSLLQSPYMTLGKRQLMALSPEACGFELLFFSSVFFPLFVVRYWAGKRGSPQVSWDFTAISLHK